MSLHSKLDIREAMRVLAAVEDTEVAAIAAEDRARNEERARQAAQEQERLAQAEREAPKRALALLAAYDKAMAEARQEAAEKLARHQLLGKDSPDWSGWAAPANLLSESIESIAARKLRGE